MSPRSTLILSAAVPVVALGVALSVGPAAAAPANANSTLIDLACSNGQSYPISVVEPSADQSAGHLVAQPGVVIPTAFQFDVTLLDEAGAVVDQFSSPVDLVRGRSEAQHDVMTCTFSQTETDVAPDGSALTIQLDGTVRAFLPR